MINFMQIKDTKIHGVATASKIAVNTKKEGSIIHCSSGKKKTKQKDKNQIKSNSVDKFPPCHSSPLDMSPPVVLSSPPAASCFPSVPMPVSWLHSCVLLQPLPAYPTDSPTKPLLLWSRASAGNQRWSGPSHGLKPPSPVPGHLVVSKDIK